MGILKTLLWKNLKLSDEKSDCDELQDVLWIEYGFV
jgi:hypothetical protein